MLRALYGLDLRVDVVWGYPGEHPFPLIPDVDIQVRLDYRRVLGSCQICSWRYGVQQEKSPGRAKALKF